MKSPPMTTLSPVGRDDDAVRAAARRDGSPLGRRAVGGVHLGEERTEHAADLSEDSTQVDARVRRDERRDVVVGVGGEAVDDRAGRRVVGDDPVAAGAADVGEVAADVQAGAVGRGGQGTHLPVEHGREGQQGAGREVVRQQVAPRGLIDSRGGAVRSRGREVAADVDGVADDDLVPDDAVDLWRGERIGRHRGRRIGR